MVTVEVFTQSGLDPAASHALAVDLLGRAATQPGRGWLCAYDLVGDVLSLGRYHLAPAGDPDGRVRLQRRLGGGRVVPLGPGFAALSLTLPHRSALVADDPAALRPEQTLNRCVRALLVALRALGVDAFYPGRDRITVGGRMLGLVSLETDTRRVAAFEAVLSIDGDWQRLGELVGAVDHDGLIAAELPAPERVTSLAQHGTQPTLDDLARCMATALTEQFGVAATLGTAPAAPADAAIRAAAWIGSRRRRQDLERHAVEWGQIGVFEVYLAERRGAIDDVLFAGDFIADSPSIAALEQRLRGCRLERAAVAAVIDAVYADPHGFLLGVGPLSAVVDTIVRAA